MAAAQTMRGVSPGVSPQQMKALLMQQQQQQQQRALAGAAGAGAGSTPPPQLPRPGSAGGLVSGAGGAAAVPGGASAGAAVGAVAGGMPAAKRLKTDDDLLFGAKVEQDVLHGVVTDRDMMAVREVQTLAGAAKVRGWLRGGSSGCNVCHSGRCSSMDDEQWHVELGKPAWQCIQLCVSGNKLLMCLC